MHYTLKQARTALGLSLQEAADKLNISRGTYAEYERNRPRGLTEAVLSKVCTALGLKASIAPNQGRCIFEVVKVAEQ